MTLRHPSNDLPTILAEAATCDEFITLMNTAMDGFIRDAKAKIKTYRSMLSDEVLKAEGGDLWKYENGGGKEGTIRHLKAMVKGKDDPYRDEEFLRHIWNAR